MSTPNLCYWTIAQTGRVVPLVSGIPGVAKTKTTEAFARAVDRPCYTLIGSIREPGDVGGYPYLTKTKTPVRDPITGTEIDVWMQLVAPKWAVDCHDGKDWIVFIDELTTCPPAVQAALLRVIAEKVVGDMPLPEKTWILTACNPSGIAANGFELEPPMANRLCHLEWETDWSAWDRGMTSGLQFPEPSFTRLPENWTDGLSKTGSMFTAFRRARPNLFEDYPQDRAKAGGPWPSPRSWTNAALCATAMEAVGADPAQRYRAIDGCIGDAGREYMTWENNLDLPDPEELLAKAAAALRAKRDFEHAYPNRADKVMAVLVSVTDRALRHNPSPKRWEAAAEIFSWVAGHQPELCVVCCHPLLRDMPNTSMLSGKIINHVLPLLQKVGMVPAM